jgi:hypothetical protein
VVSRLVEVVISGELRRSFVCARMPSGVNKKTIVLFVIQRIFVPIEAFTKSMVF